MRIIRKGKSNTDKDIPQPLKATAIRTVRFQEVDLIGVVWHGRYAEYFEDGRFALGEKYSLGYNDFFREGFKAPIVNFKIEYRKPLFFAETFFIETSLLWTEAVRLNQLYMIRRKSDGQIVSKGSTVQILLDTENNLCLVWPEYFQRFRKKWKLGKLKGKND